MGLGAVFCFLIGVVVAEEVAKSRRKGLSNIIIIRNGVGYLIHMFKG